VAPRPGSDVEPSWTKVVGTTVQLWLVRRPLRQRVLGALVVIVVVFAAGGLTVALIRHSSPADAARGNGGSAAGPAGLASVQAAAAVRQNAATWIAAQVSHGSVVSCDSAMCAALEAKGFPAGDLMTLGPGTGDPLGSAVIVASAAVRSQFGGRLTTVYAPTVIASFGSGSAQIDIRAYAAGGAAAYLAALRADQLARQNIGRKLLHNSHVTALPAAQQQLAAGQVDSRLLITIATLASQGSHVRVVAFGDAGPGANPGVPLRAAEIASPPGAKSSYLQSVLAFLRAQQPPYLAHTTLTHLPDGQQAVQIVYDAPSPLGLLSG
jgi:hypothetical protein